MMLSIFSCAYWPGVYLLWRTVCSVPLPILSCWGFCCFVLFFWSFWVIGIYPEAFNLRWTGDSVANLPYLMRPLCGQRNDQIFFPSDEAGPGTSFLSLSMVASKWEVFSSMDMAFYWHSSRLREGADKAQKAFLSSMSVETLSLSVLQTNLCCIKT